MLSLDNTFYRVSVDYADGDARISWRIQYGFDYQSPTKFRVQFSRSGINGGSDWVDIGNELTDVFSIVDTTSRSRGKSVDWHYRVKATLPDTSLVYSDPVRAAGDMRQSLWLRGRVVLRDFNVGLRRIGTRGWLLRKIQDGPEHANAAVVDPLSGMILTTRTPTTTGTRYDGGYFNPTPLVIDMPSVPRAGETNTDNGTGPVDPDQALTARACGVPYIAVGDVFVTSGSGERYAVTATNPLTQLETVPIIVALGLKKFPANHVIYSIAVPR